MKLKPDFEIRQLVPAERGWFAVFEEGAAVLKAPVACWGLVGGRFRDSLGVAESHEGFQHYIYAYDRLL